MRPDPLLRRASRTDVPPREEVTVELLDVSSEGEFVYLKGIGDNWMYVEAVRMPQRFEPLVLEVRCAVVPDGSADPPLGRIRITYDSNARRAGNALGRFKVEDISETTRS